MEDKLDRGIARSFSRVPAGKRFWRSMTTPMKPNIAGSTDERMPYLGFAIYPLMEPESIIAFLNE